MTHLAFITQSGELFSPLIPTIYNFYNSLLNKQSHCPHFTVSLSGTKQILANFSLCTSFIEHQVYYTLTYSRLQSLEVAKDVNRPLILAPVARPLMEENSLQFCDIIFVYQLTNTAHILGFGQGRRRTFIIISYSVFRDPELYILGTYSFLQ